MIDQVYLRAKNAVVSAQEDGSDADLIMKRVDKALRKFEARSRFVFLPCPDMAAEDLLIGAHDGKVFVACSGERPSGDRVYDAIRKILGGFQSGELKRSSQHIRQNHVLTENGNIARAYAKTGMNALARLRGYEYAAHPTFDWIRRWIVSGENDDEFNYLPSISVERNKLAYALPENVHFCVFIHVRWSASTAGIRVSSPLGKHPPRKISSIPTVIYVTGKTRLSIHWQSTLSA